VAVTGQQDGHARLAALELGNFLIVPMDDRRQWYRYHHLFAEVLTSHLWAEQPDQVATLHRRASAWYEQQGAAEAIRHALAAGDFARAADLVEITAPAMLRSRQEAALLGWLKALPDELVQNRPVLSVGYARALLSSGEFDGVETGLRDAEQWLDPPADRHARVDAPAAAMVVDEEEFRRLPGAIAVARAGRALALGDVPATVTYARRALELIAEDDYLGHGSAAALLGLASWPSGDLETAHRSYATGMTSLQMAGNLSDAIGCTMALADIRIAQGRLREAMRTYEHALHLATEQHPEGTRPLLRGMADMYVGISELQRERDDLQAATQHLVRSKELGEHTGLPQNRYRCRVAMARIREAQGDLDGALELLHEAERLYVSDFFLNVRPVTALKTRGWVAQGPLGEALDWARERGLSVEDDLSYLREFEHLTLARVLLARYKSERADRSILEAMGLLRRLRTAAEEGERTGSVIEILVLQALAPQTQDNIPAALMPLERALALAEPQGYVRIFIDQGAPMAQLLRAAAARGIVPAYIGRLLAASASAQQPSAGEADRPTAPVAQPMIEPLSQRELDVLRLFKTELSGPEIADALMIGLSTVRTHSKSIYSQLNVTSRRAAVNRAAELDLI
jgi:LuxR family maltose regulon positive regulatory protein